MLEIEVQMIPEMWDNKKEEFIPPVTLTLRLEHSLVSLKKWESKWCKPFLSKRDKTDEETLDYIKCMTVTQNVNPDVYLHLSDENTKQIEDYINAPMTATTFADRKGKESKYDVITAEVIYSWMINLRIPPEYQKWHLNSLLTLIRVLVAENSPPEKRSEEELAMDYAELNAARRKKYNSKG